MTIAILLLALSVPALAADPAGRPAHGAFIHSPADRVLLACGFGGCRAAATNVSEVVPDGLDGVFVFGAGGLAHCRDGSCSPLEAGLSFDMKIVRPGGRLVGSSKSRGTWACEPGACRRLTEAYFDSSWPGAFDAAGFWGSGPSGTFFCGDASCRRIADQRLEILFSAGTKPGIAWGGSRSGATWRCTETACASMGGIFWYNTYAFDADGNLFGSSGFPDSTYACSEKGCRKLDDKYRYWHGPDPRGGMLASTQIPKETHRCTLSACAKESDGIPAASSVIGPVGGAIAAPVSRAVALAGFAAAARGVDGAVYAIRECSYERLARRASAPARAGEVVRIDGGRESVLAASPAPACWSWESDEDSPSAWENSCSLH